MNSKLKNNYRVLGCMSGTSIDGLDLALVQFNIVNGNWYFEVELCQTIPYDSFWKQRLRQAHKISAEELKELDMEYALKLYEILSEFIITYKIGSLDAVCSHGHTVLHKPDEGFTVQIGNQSMLSEMLGCKVVCDFRVQDVELGGQGAPLVPVGDRFLFSDYDVAVNIGGFANITKIHSQPLVAYDICATNTVMNVLSERLGKPYDENGDLARQGKVIDTLSERLKQLEFYQQKPPKSLGIEWVDEYVWPLLDEFEDRPVEDQLATYVKHIAEQIAKEIGGLNNVLITGGGAFNNFLISSIETYSKAKITIPNKQLIEFKEAIVFGLLGVLKLRGENNIYSSVTGATKDHCSGNIFSPTGLYSD